MSDQMQTDSQSKSPLQKSASGQPIDSSSAEKPERRSELKQKETSEKKRLRYTEEEDIKILEYIKDKPVSKLTSRKFWEDAVQKDHLLDNKRSAESLRERYRFYLLKMIEGGGNIAEGSEKKSRKKKKNQENLEETKDGEGLGENKEGTEKKSQGKKKKPAKSPKSQKKDNEVEGEGQNTSSKKKSKRKEYQGMNEVEELLARKTPVVKTVPSKVLKPVLLDREEEERVEEKKSWVAEQAEKRNLPEDVFMDLFLRCSMDPTILDRYLNGETHLLWDDDEDMLLKGPAKVVGKKVLSTYKEPENVKLRVQFLKGLEKLRPEFSLVSVTGATAV